MNGRDIFRLQREVKKAEAQGPRRPAWDLRQTVCLLKPAVIESLLRRHRKLIHAAKRDVRPSYADVRRHNGEWALSAEEAKNLEKRLRAELALRVFEVKNKATIEQLYRVDAFGAAQTARPHLIRFMSSLADAWRLFEKWKGRPSGPDSVQTRVHCTAIEEFKHMIRQRQRGSLSWFCAEISKRIRNDGRIEPKTLHPIIRPHYRKAFPK